MTGTAEHGAPDGEAPDGGSAGDIVICALTFLRPVGLKRLLDHLRVLELPSDRDVSVVIVDNDPKNSAQEIVTEAQHDFPVRLVYVPEPTRGVSATRNKGVSTAVGLGARFIAFIDDDEWPDNDWLCQLVESQSLTGANVVTGPVMPSFDVDPPRWIVDGGFFERPTHGHNSPITYATTSSVLIELECLQDFDHPFDLSFGLSGGEDTHLFRQLQDRGCLITWCDRAVVTEAIPESRLNFTWILKREYRRGQTLSLSLLETHKSFARIAKRVLAAGQQLFIGAIKTVLGVPFGRARLAIGVHQMAFGAGLATGLAGRRHQEYEQHHGN